MKYSVWHLYDFKPLRAVPFYFHFLRSLCCLFATCGLSPFAVTQKHCSAVRNKVLVCDALGLMKNIEWQWTLNLTRCRDWNQQWNKWEKKGQSGSLGLICMCLCFVFYYYFCSSTPPPQKTNKQKQNTASIPTKLLPPTCYHNTSPSIHHTKEFQSSLGWRHTAFGWNAYLQLCYCWMRYCVVTQMQFSPAFDGSSLGE